MIGLLSINTMNESIGTEIESILEVAYHLTPIDL